MAADDHNGRVVSTEGECPDCSVSERSFDQLAKGLASGTVSRRKALRMLGAVLAGGALASVPGAAWAAKCKPLLQKCTANRQCCSKNCIKNPQGRGRICGCPTGQTLCPANNSCVPNCPSGQALNPTTCQCTQCQNASECPIPDSECQRAICTNGVCGVENVADGTSCDDGNPCTTNDVCAAGVCAGTLTEGCVQCQADSGCASVPVDQCHRAVCGAEGFCVVESRPDGTSCDDGNPCTENDQCTAGVCSGTQIQGCVRCQNNADCSSINVDQCHEAVCNQAGVCEVQNKPDNTACDDNNACTENDVCTAGVCAGTPVAGCVPCQTDTNCSGGKTCQSGRCACPQGQTQCGGVCKDLATDVANCGTCGNVCATGMSCVGGQCACPSGQELCGGQCVTICSGGRVLNPSTCQCACPTGTTLCNNTCVNLQTDTANCGSCGNACSGGSVCQGGQCVAICPAVSCCCVCNYQYFVNGTDNYIFVCSSTNTTLTRDQCVQSCQSATPPSGTTLFSVGHACESGSSGFQRGCEPQVGSPNSTGTVCTRPQCAPPPT